MVVCISGVGTFQQVNVLTTGELMDYGLLWEVLQLSTLDL